MDIIIIGGGASGLVAGIEAAKNGATVTILEKNEKPGRKILASGNGRCNLTNIKQDQEYYRSDNPDFAWALISKANHFETMRFFTELGVFCKNKNDYIYPYSEQAASVLEVLLMALKHLKIKLKTCEEIKRITPLASGFKVKTKTWEYYADKVIIATGSKASPELGASGSGYTLAKELGHTIVKPLAALVGLDICGDVPPWGGVRMTAAINLYQNDTLLTRAKGEIQFTDYGISGIPVFSVSRFAVRAIDEGQKVEARLDLMPDFTEEFLLGFLAERLVNCPYKSIKESLIGLLPKKMIPIIVRNTQSLDEIVQLVKHYPIIVKGAHSLTQAQVCSGGVSTSEINGNTLESQLVAGLYFAGEVIDVDGDCGGYNLQWAWSSGRIAGASSAK